jgi:hypothetical protein
MKLGAFLKQRWARWVWNHTPTCAEMSRAVSQSLDRPPSLKLRLQMWLHFLICVWCQRYHKHLTFLHREAPKLAEHTRLAPARGLSEEAKQRLKHRLRDHPK